MYTMQWMQLVRTTARICIFIVADAAFRVVGTSAEFRNKVAETYREVQHIRVRGAVHLASSERAAQRRTGVMWIERRPWIKGGLVHSWRIASLLGWARCRKSHGLCSIFFVPWRSTARV